MLEKNLVVGPFQCNCRILVCPRTGEGLLVDPGDEAERILRMASELRTPSGHPLRIRYLLQTHGHLDHVGASREVKQSLQASLAAQGLSDGAPKIALHREDEPLYLGLRMQGQLFGIQYEDPLPIDHFLEEGEELRVGELKFSVIHTPGHSPGSICLRLHEDTALQAPETVFSGDTLFQGSVGRTDLWGGDADLMFHNIRTRLLTLDGDTRVCPGHGEETTIGLEKKQNPFLN